MVRKKTNMINDTQLLKTTLKSWLKISDADYPTHNITDALTHAGVTKFMDDFTILSEQDIDSLVVSGATRNSPKVPLSVIDKRRLKMVLSFYHEYSRRLGGPADVTKVTRDAFNLYRVSGYIRMYHVYLGLSTRNKLRILRTRTGRKQSDLQRMILKNLRMSLTGSDTRNTFRPRLNHKAWFILLKRDTYQTTLS